MKYILRVAEYHSKSGSQSELLYTDDKDELFIGPTKSVVIGKPYRVEVGESGRFARTALQNFLNAVRDCCDQKS